MKLVTRANPLLELMVTLIIPSLILIQFSGFDSLGTTNALLCALALPIGWGMLDWLRNRRFNLFAVLGLVGVLLTGSIGLLQLDVSWLAIKEAAMPGSVGLIILISSFTRYPLVHKLVCNSSMLNVERIHQNLEENGAKEVFESHLLKANWLLGSTFFFSASINYLLTFYIVTSPSGTPAFNEQLGQLNLITYPMIALPALLMATAILYYLSRSLRAHTGMRMADLLQQ